MKKLIKTIPHLAIVSWLSIMVTLITVTDSFAAGRKGKPPTALGSFTDQLSTFDTTRWMKADGWKNGAPFDNAWAADHITFGEGLMHIVLDDESNLGEPYTSGNYQSNGFYGYGCYEASFKPVAESGVITSFFTFAGPFDNGGNGKHNEIDIEFLGGDTWQFQTNFWTNDDSYAGGNEHLVTLPFDASQEFHRYGFKWTSAGIEWFVDGEWVHEETDSPENPTPKQSDSLQKIMMNVWPVDETASGWAGDFIYLGEPLEGLYDWVRYIEGEKCSLTDPPSSPPPPPQGDFSEIHVSGIGLTLNSRATQVIARVSVSNGIGEPVAGAEIEGVWGGIITAGDTRRTSDSDGVATFYSARSRDSGMISFCVTGVTSSDMTYIEEQNVETCGEINK